MQCAEVTSCFCSSKKRGKQAKLNKQLQNVLFFFKKKNPKTCLRFYLNLLGTQRSSCHSVLYYFTKKKKGQKKARQDLAPTVQQNEAALWRHRFYVPCNIHLVLHVTLCVRVRMRVCVSSCVVSLWHSAVLPLTLFFFLFFSPLDKADIKNYTITNHRKRRCKIMAA